MTDKFTMICDPGHGWLEVPWFHLKRLGLNPTDFTQYSYRKGNTFYLEEDCDAGKFFNRYVEVHGVKPTIEDRQEEWKTGDPRDIRSYEPIWR